MTDIRPPEAPTRAELADPDNWPFRYVTVFCDRCGLEQSTDIRADTAQEGFTGLRNHLAAHHEWLITERGDWCPGCAEAKQAPPEKTVRYGGGNPFPFRQVPANV
jgi:hypothetical protein